MSNAIYYTTSDNKPVILQYSDAFGSEIISNTYENSRGAIVCSDNIYTINERAFECCDNLTSVIIPNSVTKIGPCAFRECNSLTSIIISDGVAVIGVGAFFKCKSLAKIIIPDSVTTIEGLAFDCCDNLTSIIIPNSVTKIGSCAIENCSNLTKIYYKPINPPDGINDSIRITTNTTIFVPTASVDKYKSKLGYYASQIVGYDF